MKSVIGVFDLDNATQSPVTRKFLERAEKEKKTVNVSEELPKSFVLCEEKGMVRVYISQLSTSTLLKRTEAMEKIRNI